VTETTSACIISLGHGGGVVGAPSFNAGNTNFAFIKNLSQSAVDEIAFGLDTSNDSFDNEALIRLLLSKMKYWLIDIGTETLGWLAGTSGGTPVTNNIDGIAVTHAHADHAGGLAGLAWRFRFADGGLRPPLVMREELLPMLRSQLVELRYTTTTLASASTKQKDQRTEIESFYDVRLLGVGASALKRGIIFDDSSMISMHTVTHNLVAHGGFKMPAYCVRLELANGRRAMFSGDTARPLDNNMLTADIVFHDCQFYESNLDVAVHCPFEALTNSVSSDVYERIVLAHTLVEPPGHVFEKGFRWAKRGSFFFI
jgi:ribonuclease BN (tRNA processing enzyme)